MLSKKSAEKIKNAINEIDNYTFEIKPDKKFSFHALSKSDTEVLNHILEKFGGKNSQGLSEYTHKYLEWNKYKKSFECQLAKRWRVETKELLSKINNDLLLDNISDDHISQTQKFLEGNF